MQRRYPFFVYGTLLPAQPNAYLWANASELVEEALFSNGRLYDCGFFPMLIGEGAETVRGVLLTIKLACYEAVLTQFDRLEGVDPKRPFDGAYRREVRRVVVDNGRFADAWVYVGQKQFVMGRPIITDGDWQAHVQNNESIL